MPSLADPVLRQYIQQCELEEISVSISRRIATKVYSTTKPHNLKIASLQKGLVLLCNGIEVIGEGVGFGVPVVEGPEETYFSGSATVTSSSTSESFKIRKTFNMDRTSRNRLGNLPLESKRARGLIRYLSRLYQENKGFRSILRLKELAVNMGVEATFKATKSLGKIPVTYEISRNVVNARVDFSQIGKDLRNRAFVLNEQSASFFRRYSDSNGTTLANDQIGAWDNVEAKSGWFTDTEARFGFRLWQVNGTVLRRGREVMRGCMDWVGLDYEVNPNRDVFEYKIELLGAE